jgi:hypothetical protein
MEHGEAHVLVQRSHQPIIEWERGQRVERSVGFPGCRSWCPSVSLDPATGVIGHRHSVESGVRSEQGRDRLRRNHVLGLAVDIVQVAPMALLVPHDADEFIPGHKGPPGGGYASEGRRGTGPWNERPPAGQSP